MKILVISSCSKRQNKGPVPAIELYGGPAHKYVVEGLTEVRQHSQSQKITFDLFILSTEHGLIRENKVIDCYNVKNKNAVWKQFPYCVCEKVLDLIHNYDLVFFLLGQDVEALQLADQSFKYSGTAGLIFFLAPTWSKMYIPSYSRDLSNIYVIDTGKSLADDVRGGSQRTIGWFVFKKLCEVACSDGFDVFESIKENPYSIPEIVRNK